jgi:hypothetical protein
MYVAVCSMNRVDAEWFSVRNEAVLVVSRVSLEFRPILEADCIMDDHRTVIFIESDAIIHDLL